VVFGQPGIVTFRVESESPIVALDVDLLGDGVEAPTRVTGNDLRPVLALAFLPALPGTFELQLRARDASGCEGATGLRRDVTVQ
jgi:hypothetical protein